ncbi:MAG: mechanosensitive ion channel [Cellvibrionaceae bacterium]
MNEIKVFLENLDTPLEVHGMVFFLNLLIFLASRPFLQWFNKGKDITVQARALRFGAVLFFGLHLLDLLLINALPEYEHYFIRFGLTIATFFGCLLFFNLVSYFSRQKFGRTKEIDDETIYLDSYNSRLMDLISAFVIVLIALYCLIVIWKLEGLLQTTGFLGIVFAFLALTNAIWAPDIYYGMVILNTDMLEDGDVVKLGDSGDEYIISRVTLIYTILLDVRNNHRILLRNSQVLNARVDNLSKRASIDGLRHSMEFNIGYPRVDQQSDFSVVKHTNSSNKENPEDVSDAEENKAKEAKSSNDIAKSQENSFENLNKKIHKMFQNAFEELIKSDDSKLNKNIPFEITLINSGDYALTYSLHFYLDALPNTKVTKTIRKYLTGTPNLVQNAVNASAVKYGIQLATPIIINTKTVSD